MSNSGREQTSKPTPRRVLSRFLRGTLIGYLLVVILLGFLQRNLLYHPKTEDRISVERFEYVSELYPASRDIELSCADGKKIRGWLLQKNPVSTKESVRKRPLVIFFHGNAGNRVGRTRWYQLLERVGADVLALDYHGYGDSEGTMSELAMEMDCDAAWACATEQLGYHPADLVVMGSSLGGAAAVYLTSGQCRKGDGPAAMIAVSTFSSMTDVGSSLYPWLPVRWVLVDRYPSEDRIQNVTCPVLLLHGDRDAVVHQRFGKQLFDATPENSGSGVPKRWVNLPNTGHNDIIDTAGEVLFQEITRLMHRIQR